MFLYNETLPSHLDPNLLKVFGPFTLASIPGQVLLQNFVYRNGVPLSTFFTENKYFSVLISTTILKKMSFRYNLIQGPEQLP